MAKDTVEVKILAETRKAIAGFAKFAAGVAGATVAIRSFARLAASAIKAYEKQETAVTKLNAALRATGGVVGISSRVMQDMAAELSSLTGITDEAIIEAQALMTTFTQIGKEAFPDAIKAATDMSTMFGQDLRQSVIQLGTALNDPIVGVGRLKRIGISFSEDQKKQIRQHMEMNDILSAQRVILDELGVEIGGVAEAMGETATGSLKKLSAALGDLKEASGKVAIEGLRPIVDWLTRMASEAAETSRQMAAVKQTIADLAVGKVEVGGLELIGEEIIRIEKLLEERKVHPFLVEQTKADLAALREAYAEMSRVGDRLIAEDEERRAELARQREMQAELTAGWETYDEAVKLTTPKLELQRREYQGIIDGLAGMRTVLKEQGKWHGETAEQIQNQINLVVALRDELGKVPPAIEEIQAAYAKAEAERIKAWTAIKEEIDALEAIAKKQIEAIESVLVSGMVTAMQQMGTALIEGGEAWAKFGQNVVNIIADILLALSKEFFAGAVAKAAVMALSPGPLFLAAAGAAIAAGIVRAIGNKMVTPMAEGGIVTKPTLALIGERGPEVVTRLDQAGAIGNTYYITVQGSVITKEQLFDEIGKYQFRRARPY